ARLRARRARLGERARKQRNLPPGCADRAGTRAGSRSRRRERFRSYARDKMKARFEAEDDVIVITGGANGIGLALALAAAETGARVFVCDIDAPAMATVAGKSITTQRLDVTDRAAVIDVFRKIEREAGRIDGLVCSAAIQPRKPAHDMDPAEWTRVLSTNLDGVVWCYQAAIAGMIARRRGSI